MNRQVVKWSSRYAKWVYAESSISNHYAEDELLKTWWWDNWMAICKLKFRSILPSTHKNTVQID